MKVFPTFHNLSNIKVYGAVPRFSDLLLDPPLLLVCQKEEVYLPRLFQDELTLEMISAAFFELVIFLFLICHELLI